MDLKTNVKINNEVRMRKSYYLIMPLKTMLFVLLLHINNKNVIIIVQHVYTLTLLHALYDALLSLLFIYILYCM
jgi:hypothetical protein